MLKNDPLVKKISSPGAIAAVFTVILVIWLFSGEHKSALQDPPEKAEAAVVSAVKVETQLSIAEAQPQEIVVQGNLQPWKKVELTAQVSGRIEAILKTQGESFEQNEPLIQLSDEGREAKLAQAKALVKLREAELNSAQTLRKSQFTSKTQLRQMESELAQAKAALVSARLDNGYSQPIAPFAGVADRRHVEPGQWVAYGQKLMDLIQIDKLKVTAYIPQQKVGQVQVGQDVVIQLLDGRTLDGKVNFISFDAEPGTRSFYVEAITQNPENLRIAGASATLRIKLPSVNAHKVSPALLSLDNDGKLGIYAVNSEDKVVFHAIQISTISAKTAIVTGLPDRVRIITLGAGFVRPGDKVEAVEAKS